MSGGAQRRIRRLLVANRGEIAVRILRACRQVGVETVAVISEADRVALHAQLADQVVEIGPPAAAESYLRTDRLIEAARKTQADAIHPGYGFLAENADFARAVAHAGLLFVGPDADVIEEMGVKTRARARMKRAGVPIVPGASLDPDEGPESWARRAEEVGYPLLVKAASGGGGKGMRAVQEPSGLEAAIGAAQREAQSAFGDPTVYLERLLARPRHVEVQVLGDSHGNVIHLGERDCSIQRRHQKIIEESPAPRLDEELRQRMHEAAVAAAQAVGYRSAGTVEMLYEAESGAFYFLEMNTRLQVEHPVTELISGVDLVAEQIRVAEGARLSIRQEEVALRGHAIEARLYAEDPTHGFLPQSGVVRLFEPPSGPGVRVDTGIISGAEVTLHYDPMIAKISAWGSDRDEARRRLVEALKETVLLGPTTNAAYLLAILQHEAFARGEVQTGFLSEHLHDWNPAADLAPEVERALLVAAAAIFGNVVGHGEGRAAAPADGPAPVWENAGPLRLVSERKR